MTTSLFPSELAYFLEASQQGTPPADGTAWVASGQQVRHIADSLSVESLKRAQLDDARSQVSVFGLERKVEGLANADFGFDMYLSGTGATTAAGSQVTMTPLGELLQNCLGGLHRSNSTEVAAGNTSISFDVDVATDIIVGSYVAVAQATSPNSGYARRVSAVAGTTVTLDHDLPFTPAIGDLVYGCETAYVDESVLIDSSGAAGRTLSYLIEKGGAESWQAMGCKNTLGGMSLARGDLPLLSIAVMCASHLGPNLAPSPAWSATPWGPAPIPTGNNTRVLFTTVGQTNNELADVNEISIDPGVPAVRVPTVTERQNNMEATHSYSISPADTTATLNIVALNTALWDDKTNGVLKQLRFSQIARPGQGFAVELPSCELVDTPSRSAAEAVSATSVSLRSLPPAGTALQSSKILIVRW